METLNRAVTWLTKRSQAAGSRPEKSDPIFLFLHFYEPHAPYTPPVRFRRGNTPPYDGTVMYTDEIMGSLLTALRGLDLYDPSLIILLSDHGEGLDEHGEATHGVFLYREVMRVPLIVKLPGNQNGGSRIEAPVQLIDITPTILDWVGLPAEPHLQGKSLVPALRHRRFPGDRRIYGESLYGRLHFGWSVTSSESRLSEPVAREYARMRNELRDYIGQSGLTAPSPVDEAQLRKLRALGYVGSPTLESSKDTAAPDPKDRIGDLALYQQAMRLKRLFMFAQVAETLREVLKNSPRMIDAWDQLSEADRRLGRLDEAADGLTQGLRIAPQRTTQRLELVDILTQLKRFDEARRELQVATSQQPEEAETRLALLEIAAGRPEAARDAARRAARTFPAAVPFTEGVLPHEKEEYAKALPLFRKALAGLEGRSPDALPYIYCFLGDTLARESQNTGDQDERARFLAEAEQHLLTELSLKPTDAAAASSLCFVHALNHDLRKIDQGLNEFARQNPSVGTYQLIAHLYTQMDLNDRAALWSARARRAQTNPGQVQ